MYIGALSTGGGVCIHIHMCVYMSLHCSCEMYEDTYITIFSNRYVHLHMYIHTHVYICICI